MAISLVTGHTGTEHVTAAQAGLANAGVAGTGMYVFDVLQKFKCTVASANSVSIGTGVARMNGRDIVSETATSLSVANGVSGQNRRDLVVARYQKTTSTGVESVSLVVIKGTATTGTPADPAYNNGSVIDGKTTVDMPLWRLPINGVNIGTPVQLFTVVPSLKSLGDSVSQARKGIVTAQWNDIEVKGFERAGIAIVRVSRWGQSGTSLVPAVGNASQIGTIAAGYRPATYWQASIGLDACIVEACPDGRVLMYSLDGQSHSVAAFRGELSYPIGC